MPSYPSLDLAGQTALLRRVIERARERRAAGAVPPVIVFDLDGTLMDNRPRSAAILIELGREWASKYPEAAERLASARPDELAYLFNESLQRLGVSDRALVDEAMAFWRERFFRDKYLSHDVEVPGAVAFAQAAYEAGAVLVYLTGRDLPLMGLGSWSSLRDLGFPIGVVGTELVCKPDASVHDEVFKLGVAPALARVGEVIAAFDNEPGNCNIFRRAYPSALTVLLDTQHVPGAPPLDEGVVCVRDFRLTD
jgi:haloacid dehalogenase-like hydrolase